MNISEKNETKGLITWRISARAEVSARLTELEKKTRLHGKFQAGLKLNVRAGSVVFYIYCCTQGFYACVYEFSARAEISCRLHGEFQSDQPG